MNTLEVIQRQEQALKDLPKCKKYTFVCFGASTASKRALKVLQSINMAPDYICDNDTAKQTELFEGYKVYSPETLFEKPLEFFVIINSMYYSEIKEQLALFPNVKESLFYLDVIPTNIVLSGLLSNLEVFPVKEFETPFNIKIINDENRNSKQYTTDLKQIQKYGFKSFLNVNICENYDEKDYLNYMSYINETVFKDEDDYLNLIETDYNFNELSYKRALEYHLFNRYRKKNITKEIFINKWELLKKGDLLGTTAKLLMQFSTGKIKLIESTQKNKKTKKHALVWHLYHADMFDEIKEELAECAEIFDIYISITLDCTVEEIRKIISIYPQAQIFLYENRGRDILPFLNIFREIERFNYTSICKIHTKKSIYQHSGKDWGKSLRVELFNAHKTIIDCFNKDNSIGAFIAKNNISTMHKYLDANLANVKFVATLIGKEYNSEFNFPVGTMFWCRPEAIKELIGINLEDKYFTLEGDSLDGHIEHAVERVMGLLIHSNGYELKEV